MTKCLAELKRRPRKVEDPDAQEHQFHSLSSLATLCRKQANDLVLHTNLKLLRLLICQQQITSFEDNVELKRLSQSDEGSQADSNNFLQIVAKGNQSSPGLVTTWAPPPPPPPLQTLSTPHTVKSTYSRSNMTKVGGESPGGALVTKNRGRGVVEEEGDGGGGDYGAGFDLIQG